MDNNHSNYNSNGAAYEDTANDKEYFVTYGYITGANSTHEDGTIYPPTSYTNNPTANYKQETMDNNAADKTPVMGATGDTVIMDVIEN